MFRAAFLGIDEGEAVFELLSHVTGAVFEEMSFKNDLVRLNGFANSMQGDDFGRRHEIRVHSRQRRYLLVMADRDASYVGEEAAQSSRERMLKQGREVFVLTPEEAIPKDAKGIDWNDVLCRKGRAGFDMPGFI